MLTLFLLSQYVCLLNNLEKCNICVMRKIGLLTYHSVYNFGANLQALSTLWYFKNHGYDIKIINWRPKDLSKNYKKTTSKKQVTMHESFFERFFDLTDVCYTDEDIIQVIESESIDVIVIGSDAVCRHFPFLVRWRPSRSCLFLKNRLYTPDIYPNPFWGSFYGKLRKKVPMILMSVSSQGTLYKYTIFSERKKLAKALDNFSFISVRDHWTQKVFGYFSYEKKMPKITPDPVFGFNMNVPASLLSKDIIRRFCLPERYIILSFKQGYLPSRNWVERFVHCCSNQGISVVSLPYPQEENCLDVDINISLPINPIEWYNIIKYSIGYVGNNMHPIVVSMHNAVPFFSFDYYGYLGFFSRKVNLEFSKIYDLLINAGFLECYVNMQSSSFHFPEPEFVFDKVYNFDLVRGRYLAKEKEKCYIELMKSIEEVINK